jgi:hypothetical protein
VERQDREQPPLAHAGQVDRRVVEGDRVYATEQPHTLDRSFRARHERIVSRRLCSFAGPLAILEDRLELVGVGLSRSVSAAGHGEGECTCRER